MRPVVAVQVLFLRSLASVSPFLAFNAGSGITQQQSCAHALVLSPFVFVFSGCTAAVLTTQRSGDRASQKRQHVSFQRQMRTGFVVLISHFVFIARVLVNVYLCWCMGSTPLPLGACLILDISQQSQNVWRQHGEDSASLADLVFGVFSFSFVFFFFHSCSLLIVSGPSIAPCSCSAHN